MTTQEHLEWLHENEWSDSRIANWVSQKLNNLVSTGIFTSHETLGGDILPGLSLRVQVYEQSLAGGEKEQNPPADSMQS